MLKVIITTAAITAALTAVIVLGVVSLQTKPVQAQSPQTTYAPTPQPTARYQIFYSPLMRADTYLVDTQTGAVWQEAQGSNGVTMFQSVTIQPQGEPISEAPVDVPAPRDISSMSTQELKQLAGASPSAK
jgi:hypothetical protein